MENNTWLFKGNIIKSIDDFNFEGEIPYGFIYIIHNISNGRSYIGRKNFYSERKVSLTKKEISLLENKRLKKWKLVKKESNWLHYTGSCADLNLDIKNGDKIMKEILFICRSKREINYQEVKHLFVYEVLESDKFYNSNIAAHYYKGNLV